MNFAPLALPLRHEHIASAAIAINRTIGCLTHVGILFRDSRGQIRFCDLTLGEQVRNSPSAKFTEYTWTIPRCDPLLLEQVADICEKLSGANVPYAFKYSRCAFSLPDGRLVISGDSHGVTCATFVLAVFLTAGVQLVDQETWQVRPDDEVTQHEIVRCMRNYGISQEVIARNLAEIPCTRIRPEEVLAASRYSSLPVAMNDAQRMAKEILQWMDEVRRISGSP